MAAGCGGTPGEIGELYAKKDRTFSSVMAEHRDTFMGSPFGSAVGGFFNVGGSGSCPLISGSIPWLNVTMTFDALCSSWALSALAVLKGALLIAAAFFAFRIAVE